MTELSSEIRREVSVVLDRRGRVLTVSVSDAGKTELPPISGSESRLSGFHLVHTHPKGGALSKGDLSALFLNRLDAIAAIEVRPDGLPGRAHLAHLTPPNATLEEEDWRIHPPQTVQQLEEFDLGAQVQALEEEFSRFARTREAKKGRERALLVQVDTGLLDAEERLAELSELARTSGAEVVYRELIYRRVVKSGTLIGAGKLEELTSKAYHLDADLLIFGQELSPAQAREIEAFTGLKVIDRTQLILDIFALHAQGVESRAQVELAQLRYMKPRLLGQGTALSRLGGGIGTRGPGETKLEMDRRHINDRIAELEREIEGISKRRAERRKSRGRNAVPVIGIVGYTNAGKSTLLNHLTHAPEGQGVLAENKLFATLRPTSRQGFLPGIGGVILTDTVGFIRDLPADLQRAFRATLEELGESDLLLHLVDAATPGLEGRLEAVERILRDLDLAEIPQVVVLNKADQANPRALEEATDRYDALAISALTGAGVPELRMKLAARLEAGGADLRDPALIGNAYAEKSVSL
ncbi:GTP-binding protein HflX [Deinobacterium chartae]|uniref:GTPase HflX n=1 Tax=Deinobacterium chartae TaxID=521158 RepID=A0A841I1N3_9DEIO|nr:GTPase HflX [Deinobacterium chartae]MBB6099597.1 GTP-binding protein HflX [Deinobacterium chartae]